MNLLFSDTETTGTEEEDRLCQMCFQLGDLSVNKLYKPPIPIKLQAMAVHHITNRMVADKPPFEGSEEQMVLKTIAGSTIFVAHNARFDLGMLAKEGVEFPRFIDTLKIARHLDEHEEFEAHNLQYLRYFYEHEELDVTAHDALGDVVVLKLVFDSLGNVLRVMEGLNEEEVIDRMLEISSRPSLIRKFNFGKHKDMLVADVARIDRGYLQWLRREKMMKPEGEEDWLFTLNTYLDL